MSPVYLLLALDSPFSRPVLQTLLNAGHSPTALILPNPDRTAPLSAFPLSPSTSSPFHLISPVPSLTQTASRHNIPLLTLGNLRHPDTLASLHSYQPDLLLTACFPRLLPPEILSIPRVGCLNLHPSLLPAYRGPEPLFWQFYFGDTHTGVTLHWMDEGADTGDIVFQTEVPFPDGISLAQAETLTALAGGELLRHALANPEHLPRTPQSFDYGEREVRKTNVSPPSAQDAAKVRYFPRPTSSDLVIPTHWTARRAYNFMRAARDWGPFEIIDHRSGQRFWVREVVAWEMGRTAVPQPNFRKKEGEIHFTDGVVICQMTGFIP